MTFFCDFYATDCNTMPKKDVTRYDIPEKLNLAYITVSRGSQDNTFGSRLPKQKTNTSGVTILELNSNFNTSVLPGIEKFTAETGYEQIIALSTESYEKEVANAMNLSHKIVAPQLTAIHYRVREVFQT